MRSRIEIVPDVSFQRPSQMPFSEHDHMIEALSANASDESFREWILPRTLRRCEHFLNAHSLNPGSQMATVDSVTISNHVPRCCTFRKRLDNLLCGPYCRGKLRNIEMEDTSKLMCQHNKDVQHARTMRSGTVTSSNSACHCLHACRPESIPSVDQPTPLSPIHKQYASGRQCCLVALAR